MAVTKRAAAKKTTVKKAVKEAKAKIAKTGNGGGDYVSRARPIGEFPDIADVMPDLCTRYREIADEISKLDKERKELSATIMPLMEAVECDSITGEGWTAVRAEGANSSVSPELLLAKGVSMKVIKACTKTTKYHYVQVRAAPTRTAGAATAAASVRVGR